MRIVFMGTPEFAVASLSALLENNLNVVAVVTVPDKPSGRGRKLHESAIKKFAQEKGLPVLQPVKLRSPDFIETLEAFKADLQVVVAFRMLPEVVWDMPPRGTINLHASLLPQYRGAAPINRAVMNGEEKSGVTIFKLQHEIDTGQIIDWKEVPIAPNEDAGVLHDKLMNSGAQLLVQSVQKIAAGTVHFVPQSSLIRDEPLKNAPKIFKEDCKIDWNWEVNKIYNHIRGLSPYPGAWTLVNGKTFKIFKVEMTAVSHSQSIGKVETDDKTFVKIFCKGGFISLKKIQPAGKRKMDIEDFLRGFRGAFLLGE